MGDIGLPELIVILIVLAILAVIAAAVIYGIVRLVSASGKVRCPPCAERIQSKAKVCRFCRHPLG
jgi:hypothetical protein